MRDTYDIDVYSYSSTTPSPSPPGSPMLASPSPSPPGSPMLAAPTRAATIRRTFRTLGHDVIYSSADDHPSQRGTRVWKVKEVLTGEEAGEGEEEEAGEVREEERVYVLKDVWVGKRDTRWQVEGDVYRAVSAFVDSHPEFEGCRRNFFGVVADGLVSAPGPKNENENGAGAFNEADVDVDVGQILPSERYVEDRSLRARYTPTLHYRIVFGEVGVPLYDLESDEDAFEAIAGAVQGVFFLLRRSSINLPLLLPTS